MSFFSRLQTLDLQNVLKAGRGHYAGHLNIWHQKLFSARYVTYFFVCILKIYQRNQETLLCILVSDPRIFVAFFKDKKTFESHQNVNFFYGYFTNFTDFLIVFENIQSMTPLLGQYSIHIHMNVVIRYYMSHVSTCNCNCMSRYDFLAR